MRTAFAIFFALSAWAGTFAYEWIPPQKIQKIIDDDFSQETDLTLIDHYVALERGESDDETLTDFYVSGAEKIDGMFASKSEKNANLAENPYTLADFLNQAMHDIFFLEYMAEASLMSDVCCRGQFNCVSSCVLYAALLLRYGFSDFCFCETTDGGGHVFALVNFGGERILVETASKFGFDPGIERRDENGGVFSHPKREYGSVNEIPLKSLLALAAQNEAVLMRNFGKFEQAYEFALVEKALRQDSVGDSHCCAILSSLVSHCADTGDLQGATDFYQALPKDWWSAAALGDKIASGWAEFYCGQGRYADAFEQIKKIGDENLREGAISDALDSIAVKTEGGKGFDIAFDAMETARESGFSDLQKYKEVRAILVRNFCAVKIGEGNFEGTKFFLYAEFARGEIPRDELAELFVSAVSKESDAFFKKKDFDSCIASIKEGLEVLPQNEILTQNLRVAFKALLRSVKKSRENAADVAADALLYFPSDKEFLKFAK